MAGNQAELEFRHDAVFAHRFNLLPGSLGTLAATPRHLATLVGEPPAGLRWAVAGNGRFRLGVNATAISTGAHVRLGLQDDVCCNEERTTLATHPAVVERVVAIDRETATPADYSGLRTRPDTSAR